MSKAKKSDRRIKHANRKKTDTSFSRFIRNNYKRMSSKQELIHYDNIEGESEETVNIAINDSINTVNGTAIHINRKAIKKLSSKINNIDKAPKNKVNISHFTKMPSVVSKYTTTKFTNVKNLISNTKIIMTTLFLTGSVAIVFSLLVCMMGLLFGSPFGIFMSTEDTGTGFTLTSVVQEIEKDYSDKIRKIKVSNPHDDFELFESKYNLKEILAVYAVSRSTDSDIVIFNVEKKNTLKKIFWDFVEVKHDIVIYPVIEQEEVYDEFGNIYIQETITYRTKLIISTKVNTLEDTIKAYKLNKQQLSLLEELLSEENSSLWNKTL